MFQSAKADVEDARIQRLLDNVIKPLYALEGDKP